MQMQMISQKCSRAVIICNINGYQYTICFNCNQCPELSKLNALFWTALGIDFAVFLRLNKGVKLLVSHRSFLFPTVILAKQLT